jgi:hypothetical protein
MERIKEQYGGNCRREKQNKSKREMRKIKSTAEKKFQYSVCQRKAIYYILTELVEYPHNAVFLELL